MHLTSARAPRWSTPDHTTIDLLAKFLHLGDQEVPFTASPNDCEEHGCCIFKDAVEGKYGPIAEYVPPPPPTEAEVTAQVLAQRDAKLRESDWSQLADVPEETKLKWQPYRQALRDITLQASFPYDIVWPTPPS